MKLSPELGLSKINFGSDLEIVIFPVVVSFASDLKKLAEEMPSRVSASSPLPEPSTVFILVNKSDADNLAAGIVPDVKSAAE